MMSSIRSELVKLRTTRTVYYLLAAVVAISIVTVLDPGHSAATFRKPFNEQTFLLFASMLTRLFIFVLGVRLMTDEFRHGTIVSTLLASPRRGQLIASKAMVAGGAGLVAGTVAWFTMTSTAAIVASSEGATLTLDVTAWKTLAGMATAGMAWGAIGAFVGAIVRNQLAATVGGLVWLMGIEEMVRGLLGDLGGFLPGQAGLVMVLAPPEVDAYLGFVTMAVYLAAFAILARSVMTRDIA